MKTVFGLLGCFVFFAFLGATTKNQAIMALAKVTSEVEVGDELLLPSPIRIAFASKGMTVCYEPGHPLFISVPFGEELGNAFIKISTISDLEYEPEISVDGRPISLDTKENGLLIQTRRLPLIGLVEKKVEPKLHTVTVRVTTFTGRKVESNITLTTNTVFDGRRPIEVSIVVKDKDAEETESDSWSATGGYYKA